MPPGHTTAIPLDDDWLERLGLGQLVVHGRTVVRASPSAGQLLGCPVAAIVGRDLASRVNDDHQEAFVDWISQHYSHPEFIEKISVGFIGATGPIELRAGAYEGGSSNTRMIVLRAAVSAPAENNAAVATAELRRTLKELLDGAPAPTFVLSNDHRVMHWNRACETIIGKSAEEILGTRDHWKPFYSEARPTLADLVLDGISAEQAGAQSRRQVRASTIIPGGLEASDYFAHIGEHGRWLQFTAAPIRSATGHIIGSIETLFDVTELKLAEKALRESQSALEGQVQARTAELQAAKKELEADIVNRERAEAELLTRYSEMTALNIELHDAKAKIEEAHNQLVQNEKLASIGQLAAGVAHEINNPIGYVFSNFGSLEGYLNDMMDLLDAYEKAEPNISDEEQRKKLGKMRNTLDLPFLRDDTVALMRESKEGIVRVRKIVQDLKDFSHVDASADWQWADILRGLDSTLNIAHNEIKYRAEIVRELEPLPNIQCMPSQLNQVFMNMAVNAAHAMENMPRGKITVRSEVFGDQVCISFTDSGCGMSPETISRIFDPFYTTKPIGKGTGLGLSLSYGIINKHNGRIEVESTVGVGTTFKIFIPISQGDILPEANTAAGGTHA